jgi:hypothetical protein
MSEGFEFYGSIKSHRTFSSKGGGLIVQIELSDKSLASKLAENESVDYKFSLTPGKDPRKVEVNEDDEKQEKLDLPEEKD